MKHTKKNGLFSPVFRLLHRCSCLTEPDPGAPEHTGVRPAGKKGTACPIALLSVLVLLASFRAVSANPDTTSADEKGYRIDQPGTITFTVGVTIKGKVEKPQVMIFLPKEKPYYRNMDFSFSFKDELNRPLPYKPVLE